MTVLGLGTASHALARSHRAGRRRGARAVAVPHPPPAWADVMSSPHPDAAIRDLGVCLILAVAVAGLLFLVL